MLCGKLPRKVTLTTGVGGGHYPRKFFLAPLLQPLWVGLGVVIMAHGLEHASLSSLLP